MLDCESGEGKATAYPPSRAPLTSMYPYGCGDPPKISGACDEGILGVLLIPGIPHERPISPRSLVLFPFECFAPFMPSSRRFGRIDIAGVGEVELDGIVTVVEWCVWVWPWG